MTRTRYGIVWAALALFPLAFFAVNRAWMYSTQDFPDAWMYTGYFLHPELLYADMPGAYQGTRVLHILPGWLAHHWLPVAAAIFAQKALLFYLGTAFLYGALRALFRNTAAALIGAVLGLTNGLMIYNLSWNYVFNTAPVLLLGTLWAQARMRESRRWPTWAMLAGALYVGGVWTYLPMALAAPMVFALFVYGLPERSWRRLAAGLGWAALGGVLGMVGQGLISKFLGGPFWYFLPQFKRAEGYLAQDWFIPIEYWWRQAVWLPYLGLVAVLAALAVWRGGEAKRWTARLAEPLPFVSVVFLGGLAWFALLDAAQVHVTLQNREQASFLYPLAFLVTGGWVAWLLAGQSERRQWLVAAVAGGGILIVYGWLGYFWPARWVVPWVLLFVPLAVAAGLVGVGAQSRAAMAAALVFVLSLAGLNMYLAPRGFLEPKLLQENIAYNESLYATVRQIDGWDRQGRVWFWDRVDAPNGWVPRLLSYFYLWNHSLLGERFPGTIGGSTHAQTSYAARKFLLQPGMRVLLFDPKPDELMAAQIALVPLGLRLELRAQMLTPGSARMPALKIELWEAVPIAKQRSLTLGH